MTGGRLEDQIWVNGELLPANQANISISDRGFSLGDGLFETMLWDGGAIRFLDDHMARLSRSADALDFILPDCFADIGAGLRVLAQNAAATKAVIRLTLSRGTGPRGLSLPSPAAPQLIATIAPFFSPTKPASLKTVAITRNVGAPSSRFKSLSYMDNIVALRDAKALGADEALMLGSTGNIACASSANVIIRLKGVNLTPALSDGALPGIVRGRLIQAGLVEEAHVSPAQIADCQSGVLTNALIGVREIANVDGHPFLNELGWISALNAALTKSG